MRANSEKLADHEVKPMLSAMFAAVKDLGPIPEEHVFEAAFEAGWLAQRERERELAT